MRIKNVVHRKEAYLGSAEIKVEFRNDDTRYVQNYDTIPQLLNEWQPHPDNPELVLETVAGAEGKCNIRVYYQDGRRQQNDKYTSLSEFLKIWQDQDEFFTPDNKKYNESRLARFLKDINKTNDNR